jgi:hypothetical protein
MMQTIRTDDHPFDSYPLPPMEFFAASHVSLALGTAGSIDIAKLALTRSCFWTPIPWFTARSMRPAASRS